MIGVIECRRCGREVPQDRMRYVTLGGPGAPTDYIRLCEACYGPVTEAVGAAVGEGAPKEGGTVQTTLTEWGVEL